VLNWLSPRVVRRLYWLRERDPVPEELRGWSWSSPPLRPRAYFGLGVSEVAYRYCETFRDVWLRRRAGIGGRIDEGSPLFLGRVVHHLVDSASRDVRRMLERGLAPSRAAIEIVRLARARAREAGAGGDRRALEFYATIALGFLCQAVLSQGAKGWQPAAGLPPATEYAVDGSPLGLSPRLRVDAIIEAGVIVEYKLGNGSAEAARRHAVGLAGYALALESELEVPVDFGLLVQIGDFGATPRFHVEPVYIDATLRRRFVDNRDDAIEALMSSSPPPKMNGCPEACPYYGVCNRSGGGG